MHNFDILDCTLRDGGYYSNWDFPEELLISYFDAVRSLPIRYVEVGYRSPEKPQYLGRFFHLNIDTLSWMRSLLRPNQGVAIMFNYKDMTPDLIDSLTIDLPGTVDLIRFACPPDNLEECIGLSRRIKARGLKVAINVMYMGKYVDRATDVLAPLANAADAVDYVALVDSYGSVMPDEAARTIAQAVALLPQPVGYHGHDNLSLAFANSLAALDAGATMLDATFTGMGRGAGNLKTELITVHRERHIPTQCHYGPLSKALEMFEAMQKEYGWGTNLAYMVSGAADLPQADVMDWLGTRRYQMDSIVEALRVNSDVEFDNITYPTVPDSPVIDDLAHKPALIIGGGNSAREHAPALINLAKAEEMILIHSSMRNASHYRDCGMPQLFCLAGQEFSRLTDAETPLLDQNNALILTTPPPRFRNSVPASDKIYQLSQMQEYLGNEKLGPITDEPPLGMSLMAAEAINASVVYLAGFDGYTNATVSQQGNARDVQTAIAYGQRIETPWKGSIFSVTPTLYDIPTRSLYAKIQSLAS